MFIDARTVPSGATLRGDVRIAGAGAAGIPLARALGTRSVRVVLPGGGGLEPDPATTQPDEGRSTRRRDCGSIEPNDSADAGVPGAPSARPARRRRARPAGAR